MVKSHLPQKRKKHLFKNKFLSKRTLCKIQEQTLRSGGFASIETSIILFFIGILIIANINIQNRILKNEQQLRKNFRQHWYQIK